MIAPLRIGTRASKLARWQSDWTAAQLAQRGVETEIVEIATVGDKNQSGPIGGIGGQGVFTKEIQAALLAGTVDVAVHSLKDLPTESIDGLTLAATPPREAPVDALVSRNGLLLESLPVGAIVGTGSLRRHAQLKRLRPDLDIHGIRGNVDTRLAKLDDGQYDAIVLAAAGLTRLGCADRITELLAPPRMLPAPGQGALGLECRADDESALTGLQDLNDAPTRAAVDAERAMLAKLHGGCSAPVAAWGRVEDGVLMLDGLVASLDGEQLLNSQASGKVDEAAKVGAAVADELLDQGAGAIIEAARG